MDIYFENTVYLLLTPPVVTRVMVLTPAIVLTCVMVFTLAMMLACVSIQYTCLDSVTEAQSLKLDRT